MPVKKSQIINIPEAAISSNKFHSAWNLQYGIFLFLFFLIFSSGYTQTDTADKKFYPVFDLYGHIGHLVKNYPHLPNSDKVLFSEINIAYQTNGNKPWHSHYHYPQVGVSLFYNDLGNKEAFGQNFCVLPNFTFRHGNTAKFFGEIRLGFGLAFFNKKYNIVENPSNLYVGSAITNVSFASYDIARFISSRVALKAGLSVFHFSNGHYQLPNIGMNIPGFNIGVKYYPYKMPEKFLDKRIEGYDDKIRFTARFGFGWHEFGYSTFPTGGPKYPVYMGTFYVSKRFTAVNNVKLGLFVNYYTSFYDFIVSQEIFKEYQHLKSSVVSVFLGHEFIIGKFGLVAEAGINVFNPFRRKFTRLYSDSVDFTTFLKTLSGNKLGVQYYPFSPEKSTKHKLYIGAYIKANLGQADFVEYGIGYTF